MAYAIIGAAWIVLQDVIYSRAGMGLFSAPLVEEVVELFVFLSSVAIFYFLLKGIMRARQKSEDDLRESEKLYRTLADASQDFIFIVSRDDVVRYVNAAGARMLGMDPAHIVGVSRSQLFQSRDSERQRARLREIAELGEPKYVETKTSFPSGERWLDTCLIPLKDADGAVYGVLGVSRDTTERKRSEDQVMELRRQLDLVLAATKINIDIIDPEFNLLYVDPSWQKLYGDPVGRKCHEYFMGLKEMCEGCLIPDALKAKRMVVTEHSLPREKDRVIQVTTLPFQDAKGRWLVAEVNVDVTERKRAEEKLKEYSERLEEMVEDRTHELDIARANLFAQAKLSAMGRMGAGIAHQMNSPLGGAMLILDVLKEELKGDQRRTHMIEKAHDALAHMRDIVECMLSLAAVRRRGRAARQQVSLNGIIARIVDVLTMEFNRREIMVVQELSSDLPSVEANEGELDQIFLNLINNAMDAIEGGGRLVIRTSRLDGVLEASVADTGQGIPPENIEKVFEPFFTTRVDRRGVGLGLSIAREIVDRYSGSISVESRQGEGTTFIVRIPINGLVDEETPSEK